MKSKSLLAPVVLLMLSVPTFGQTIRRDGEFGDKIAGNIHPTGETDMYVSRAVKGSTLVIRLGPHGKTPYRATFFRAAGDLAGGLAVHGPRDDFASIVGNVLLKKEGRSVKTFPIDLGETGPYRVLVSAPADDEGYAFAGDYSLKANMKPPRRLALEGTYGESGERRVEIDVLAGTVVTVILRAGPGSPVPTVADLLDPDDVSLFAGLDLKVKKKSVQVKSVTLEKFGTHGLVITSETGGAWRATVKIRPPKRKAALVENLDAAAPPEDPLELALGLGEALVKVRDEAGGANRYQVLPADFRPGKRNPEPMFLGLEGGAPPTCQLEALPVTTYALRNEPFVHDEPFVFVEGATGGPNDFLLRPGLAEPEWFVRQGALCAVRQGSEIFEEGKLTGYTLDCTRTGYQADLSEITYTDDENAWVTSFVADVVTASGPGSSVVSSITRDAAGTVTGWTDVRTYGATGEETTYTVTVRDVVRADGDATAYWVDFTGPDGPHVPIPFPLFADGRALYYVLNCTMDHGAVLRNITYVPDNLGTGRLVSGYTIDVTTPDGPGTSTVSGVSRDGSDRLTGWTESRTYSASGNTYELTFRDIRRAEEGQGGFKEGDTTGYRMEVTGPGGPLGTFPFPPWRLTPEEEAALE